MNNLVSDFDYDLPEKFIAQTPLDKRDESKLLVYDRSCDKTEITQFKNVLSYLRRGDVLVINNTKVMAARLVGKKCKTDAKIEMLILKKLESKEGKWVYECLVKPLKRLGASETVIFNGTLSGTVLSKTDTAVVQFSDNPEEHGTVPLPHYIKTKLSNSERYQTVYGSISGSAAAPTAGLHWTEELLHAAKQKGVNFCEVTLHVGLGTFRPVKCEKITDHKMHSEWYEISRETAKVIHDAKSQGRRVICVGTTSLRAVESSEARAGYGETDIFIYPPYKFKIADALITNFHLPKSTLLMLVAAFVGREKILSLYELAKSEDFRFFSFGDAMLLI